jgi:hypothetical protein
VGRKFFLANLRDLEHFPKFNFAILLVNYGGSETANQLGAEFRAMIQKDSEADRVYFGRLYVGAIHTYQGGASMSIGSRELLHMIAERLAGGPCTACVRYALLQRPPATVFDLKIRPRELEGPLMQRIPNRIRICHLLRLPSPIVACANLGCISE